MKFDRGVYKLLLARLENYGPATTSDLAEVFRHSREWMNRVTSSLRMAKLIHIGNWVKGPADKHFQRVWHFGPGASAPRPDRGYVRKGNDTVDTLIMKALQQGDMPAAEINRIVFRSRSSINNSLRFLKDAELIRVVERRKMPRGFDQLVYGLPAGAFERLVSVEKGVVVPHSLSNASCDAENV